MVTEPLFTVPLSALVDIQKKWGWEWDCRIDNPDSYDKGCDCEINLSSESEARSAAVAHLEQVHGIALSAPGEAAKRVKAFLDNRGSLGGDEITTSYAAGAFKHGLRASDLRALIEWQEVTDDD